MRIPAIKTFVLCMSIACAAPAVRADTLVKIGVAGPLTGSQAASGKDNERGARLAVDDLNARRMTLGAQPLRFELISVDDQSDPKAGVTAAQKLVDSGVIAVIGHWNSGVTIPASKIYNDAKVIMITPAASNPALTEPGYPYVFRLTTDDNVLGAKMADYALNTLHLKRVAVIDDRTAYGSGVADVFVATAKKLGIDIVTREYSTDHTVDFKAVLSKIKPAKPDGIFYGGYYGQAAYLARQMRDLAVNGVLMGGDGLCVGEFPRLADGALDKKMYCPQGGTPLGALPEGKRFETRFKAAYGVNPDQKGPSFYAATMMIGDAISSAQSLSPEALDKTLHQTTFNTLFGQVRFDQRGEWIKAPMTVYWSAGGSIVPVD
ncbi:ABC transporter substrate-binding protein [Caballeronia sp. NK8]|uniref:branched-chain amino acid ABC transporter substrate-binding protein n=1 Tax=Caballeronia sp. NK8 TaxID=140098 RepID=UPI001BB60BCE|nr:branched-chain amino acid ABC transporter substrate-binding protein [Caballeronia sp. NK8]BCQ26327.1 ABC transporter substrate-binding protein [Caballeronia sp. NK8]